MLTDDRKARNVLAELLLRVLSPAASSVLCMGLLGDSIGLWSHSTRWRLDWGSARGR